MSKNKIPRIQCCINGNFYYPELSAGEDEPNIEEDYISFELVIKLDLKIHPENIKVVVNPIDNGENIIPEEQIILAVNKDSLALRKNKNEGYFMHFQLSELRCRQAYQYQVFYNDQQLKISGKDDDRVIFYTPPARRDPQPLKIAIGGDQERHEQFNPFGTCFDLDNQKDTKLLYQHIGQKGKVRSIEIDNIDEKPYQLFIHLGDLFNGELYFSLRNIFKPGRHIIEHRVKSLQAFRFHLDSDFVGPVGNNLAHMLINAVYDDHDTGGNNAGPPSNVKEQNIQKNMVDAFHELLCMENFLSEKAKKGPYYSKRIGQTEFFYLHNRYTKEINSESSYLLGTEQWSWLESNLENSKAQHKVIISPLPFVMGKNPLEDYRAHWQEWHRMMQLCRKHEIATILTADSHNYSHSELHVREHQDDRPWIIHQHLVGTLGGNSQSVSEDERESFTKPGRPPLLPQHPDFNDLLYDGSTVKAYFSPGDKVALLPKSEGDSQWCTKDKWSKKTHAYAGLTFFPANKPKEAPQDSHLQDQSASGWHVSTQLFTCSKKKHFVTHDPRLDIEYGP